MAGRSWWRAAAVVAVVGVAVTVAVLGTRTGEAGVQSGQPAVPSTGSAAGVSPNASRPDPPAPTSSTTPAPTTTGALAPTTTRPPRSATLAFSGDIITHLAVGRAGRANAQGSDAEYDFRPLFAGVAPTIAGADLAICHLETPLAFGGRFTPFPRFNGPHELAEAIADAGFDGCSTASNHSYDQASEGIDATLDVLDAAGLGHAGTARSAEEAATTSLYDVSGISVAHLSYTYGLNGFVLGADETWRVAVIDPEMIVADAARARDGGAELVVVSLHWGLEYFRMPTVAQEELARTLADSGIVDIVVGHHAHVLQPMTTIGDTLVLYGLGNMLSNQEPQCCTVYSQDGAIVTVRVADGENGVEVTGVDITPTWVDRSTMQIVPVVARLAAHETGDELPRWMAGHLEASLARTLDSLGLLGAVLPEPR